MEPKSGSLGDHDGSQLRERGSRVAAAAAAAASANRRLTRSRARELGLELRNAVLPEPGGRKRKIPPLGAEEGPKQLESLHVEKDLEESLPKEKDSGESLPKKDLEEQELQQEGTQVSIPTGGVLRRYRSRYRGSMISERDEQLLDGAPWLVHVSSTAPDGKEILRCSGTVIHRDKEKAWILTSYCVVFCKLEARLYNPMPKLAIHVEKAVHLPNKGKYEGKMLCFSERYRLALLKIDVESTIDVEPPRDGSRPCYNEKVLTLARDKDMSLRLHHGTIMWREENYFLFVNCKFLPCGLGGPVINHAGKIVGMSCYYKQDLAIISITTIRTCIKMWTKFGCIARPMLGMSFRTVSLLDIVNQDRLSYKYEISSGFIVDKVTDHSYAQKCGLRRGNVINFFNVDPCYLPEFEDYLLNIGLDSLEGTGRMNDFKLEVCDLVGKDKAKTKRTIILPLQIFMGSEY